MLVVHKPKKLSSATKLNNLVMEWAHGLTKNLL